MASLPAICEGFWDNVTVTDIQDARVFSVKLCGSVTEFCAMMAEVQTEGALATSLPSVGVGDVIITQFSFDNQWYRAEVKEVRGDTSLQVLYIDYGNEETTPKNNVKDAKRFTEMPRQAVTCTLNRIDYTAPNVATCYDKFRTACLNASFRALFVGKVGQVWKVELFHETGSVNDWFGKLSGSLQTTLPPPKTPTKLPHPHNAGVIPAKVAVDQTNKVDAGESFMCSVVYAVSPSEFWLQSSADCDSALSMSANLAELCNSPSKKSVTSPTVGLLCAALYDIDNTWYRARIEELSNAGAKVYFIDYGNTEEVTPANVAQLPSKFTEQPEYAIRASLAGIKCNEAKWGSDAIEVFSQLVLVPACNAQVVTKRGGVCVVHLTVDGKSVGKELIARGLAVEDNSELTHNGSQLVQCPQQHIEGVHKVYISWLTNPADFWVHIAGSEDTLATLQEACRQCTSQSSPMDNPTVGAACVAQYAVDGEWYRGEIEACLPNSCTILFIDHGNSENVRREDIYPASADITKIPGQAYKCSLLGLVPNDAQWGLESNDLMHKLLADGGTCAFLAVRDKSYLVELTTLSGQSVKEALLKANMAARSRRSSTMSDRSQGSHHSTSSVGRVKSVDKLSKVAADGVHHVDAAGDKTAHAASSVESASMANLGLKVGDLLEGPITHIDSIQSIYVQPSHHQNLFAELSTSLSEFFNKGQDQPVSDVAVGGCYLVKFAADGEWYRARVNSMDGSDIQVFFVDYGNSEKTTAEFMRQLPQELATPLPAQALCCSLYGFSETLSAEQLTGIKETYLYADVKGLIKSESASGAVVDLQFNGGSLGAKWAEFSTDSSVASAPQHPQPPPVLSTRHVDTGTHVGFLSAEESQREFYIQLAADSDTLASICETLVEEATSNAKLADLTVGRPCIAKFSDDEAWYRAQIVAVREGQMDVFFVDYGNSSAVNVEDVLEISEGLSKIPPLAIKCSLVAEDASQSLTDWAGEEEISIHVDEVRDGLHMVQLSDANHSPFVAQEVSQAHSSLVSAVPAVPRYPPQSTGVGEFDAFLAVEVSQKEFYMQDCATFQQIADELEAKLAEEATSNAKLADLTVGRPCIAKFSDDEAWYRAQIVAVREGQVDVFFVDYGNSSAVNVEDVLEISEGLSKIPPLAIKCSLVAEDASQSLTDWAGEDEIRVDVRHVEDGTCHVNLSSLKGEPFVSLPESRVENGVSNSPSAGANASVVDESFASPPADSPPYAGISTIRRLEKEFRAILAFEVSQQEFYIQQAPDVEPLGAIQVAVQKEGSCNAELADLTVGRPCIAKFSDDEAWYRAQIVAVREGQVDVFFVDYGNSSAVNVEDVLEISEGLSKIPPLAIKCSLVAEDASQSLTDWAGEGEIVVNVLHTAGDSLVVDLATTDRLPFSTLGAFSADDSSQSIAGSASNLMLSSSNQSGSSLYIPPQPVPGSDISSHSSICSSPMPHSLPSSIDGQSSTASHGPSSTASYNHNSTASHGPSSTASYNHNSTASHGPNSTASHGPSSAASHSHSSTASQESLAALPVNNIAPGEQKGYISYIESTSLFYVQLSSRKEDLAALVQSLEELGPHAVPEVYCSQGAFCMATYSVDNQFYRARVVDASSVGGMSTVRFVDYGNLEQVTNSSLKVLPGSLRMQSPVALECRCTQSSVLNMNLKEFTEKVEGEHLSLIFGNQTEPYDVAILDLAPGLIVDKSGLTDPNEFTAGSIQFPKAILPASGSKNLPAKVSHLVSPSLFYCQFDSYTMDKLQQAIDTIYVEKSLVHQLPANELATVGTGCVVASKEGTYSRCTVLSAPDDDSLCQVRCVDNGSIESALVGEIYKLHKDCVDYPLQAVSCSLRGVYPLVGSVWDDDVISRFSELVMGKQLTADIVKVTEGDNPEVQVRLTSGGELVTDSLASAGFCSRIPTPDTSPADFCAELCSQVKDKILSSSEDRTTLLSDKVNELVNGLDSALDAQLDSMKEEEEGACTAHDIVQYVTNNLINAMLSLPEDSPLDLTVSNKDVMRMEIKDIMGELLEEVMRMNAAIVENMMDDAFNVNDSTNTFTDDEESSATNLQSLSGLSLSDSKGAAASDVESSTSEISSNLAD